MDLVHEEDIPLSQVGEDGSQILRPLQHGAGGGQDVDPQLRGDDVGQGRLAEARRTGDEDMVQ